ncbi:hypothetical protein Scep_005610 [Stephania cephalantha]|uniref:Alpha 1,4-glycosyltransferase domain-containing protein n=1 Tax=Stephania cephalantha TaxID=152367 RepID=A0AAP0KUL9_9MAGN
MRSPSRKWCSLLIIMVLAGGFFVFPIGLFGFVENMRKFQIVKPNIIFRIDVGTEVNSLKETDGGVDDHHQRPDTLVCPTNMTAEERKAWMKKKVPEFGIFRSTALSQQFEQRAEKFFNGGCDGQFFMTWIAPVKSFRERDFIAMETLFDAHPNGCLMILSRSMDSKNGREILKPLIERGFKVTALTPDWSFLLKETHGEGWLAEIKEGRRDPGEIPLAQNLSNLLRLAVLYKYGGIYLDTDFIVLKKLTDLTNAIGAQSVDPISGKWNRVNNAILIFDKKHPILKEFIARFSLNFDGNRWGFNGPHMLTTVIGKLERRPDYNITILPMPAFYPVDWNKISVFFKKPLNKEESRRRAANLEYLNNKSYCLHLWNKHSSKYKIEEGSVIEQLISDHCILCQHTRNT